MVNESSLTELRKEHIKTLEDSLRALGDSVLTPAEYDTVTTDVLPNAKYPSFLEAFVKSTYVSRRLYEKELLCLLGLHSIKLASPGFKRARVLCAELITARTEAGIECDDRKTSTKRYHFLII